MVTCHRCGKCCNHFGLSFSPGELRKSYLNWRNKKEGGKVLRDIHLVYPMLRLRYKSKKFEHFYIYRCIFLVKNEEHTACSIQSIKPHVCRVFPDGKVSSYEGCAFQ